MARAMAGSCMLIAVWVAGGEARAEAPRALLDKYCVTCHNQKLRTAGLALDTPDATKPSANPELWERVIAKLRAGSMPPPGSPRPDAATYRSVARTLETKSTAGGWRTRTQAGSALSIVLTGRNIGTRSAIYSLSIST